MLHTAAQCYTQLHSVTHSCTHSAMQSRTVARCCTLRSKKLQTQVKKQQQHVCWLAWSTIQQPLFSKLKCTKDIIWELESEACQTEIVVGAASRANWGWVDELNLSFVDTFEGWCAKTFERWCAKSVQQSKEGCACNTHIAEALKLPSSLEQRYSSCPTVLLFWVSWQQVFVPKSLLKPKRKA